MSSEQSGMTAGVPVCKKKVVVHVLLFLMVLLVGVALGAVVAFACAGPQRHPFREVRENPGSFERAMADRVAQRYDLSTADTERVRAIMQANGVKMRALHKEFAPRMEECMAEMNSQIREVLPANRREDFDADVARMRKRMFMNDRPRGDCPGAEEEPGRSGDVRGRMRTPESSEGKQGSQLMRRGGDNCSVTMADRRLSNGREVRKTYFGVAHTCPVACRSASSDFDKINSADRSEDGDRERPMMRRRGHGEHPNFQSEDCDAADACPMMRKHQRDMRSDFRGEDGDSERPMMRRRGHGERPNFQSENYDAADACPMMRKHQRDVRSDFRGEDGDSERPMMRRRGHGERPNFQSENCDAADACPMMRKHQRDARPDFKGEGGDSERPMMRRRGHGERPNFQSEDCDAADACPMMRKHQRDVRSDFKGEDGDRECPMMRKRCCGERPNFQSEAKKPGATARRSPMSDELLQQDLDQKEKPGEPGYISPAEPEESVLQDPMEQN